MSGAPCWRECAQRAFFYGEDRASRRLLTLRARSASARACVPTVSSVVPLFYLHRQSESWLVVSRSCASSTGVWRFCIQFTSKLFILVQYHA
jgi:hypothetical protein